MIRRILTFFILLFTLILTSCEHKELKFPETVKFRSLRVVLKWEQLADFDKPEGMRVIFFPLQGRALKKVPVFGKTNKKAASYCTSEQFSDGQILNLFCLTQWLR